MNKNYEDAFDRALFDEIKPGDVVWDIGANVGFYTCKFADRVGSAGRVMAFEPSPQTIEELRAVVSSHSQVTIVPVALSDYNGTAEFLMGNDHTTNSLSVNAKDGNVVKVTVARGDDFAKDAFPNVVKLDVEGFEIEVVDGLSQILVDQRLRALFIEVHFLEISKRGLTNGVSHLKERIQQAGFSIRWLDPSHLVAKRKLNIGKRNNCC